MSLVTLARYQALTGDAAGEGADVQVALDDAEVELAEALGRPIEEAERTESLQPMRDGSLCPRATPIASVDGEYTIDGLRLKGPSLGPSVFGEPGTVEITYTGGWTAETLPRAIERDIAWAAYGILNPGATAAAAVAVGDVRTVKLGDVSISYGPGGGPRSRADIQIQWSRRTMAYRYAPARGV